MGSREKDPNRGMAPPQMFCAVAVGKEKGAPNCRGKQGASLKEERTFELDVKG